MKNKSVRTAAMFLALLFTSSCFFVGCNRWKEKNAAQNAEIAETEKNAESEQAYDLLLDAYKKTKKAASIRFSLSMKETVSDEETYMDNISGTYSKDDDGNLNGYYDSEKQYPTFSSTMSLLHYRGCDYILYDDGDSIETSHSYDQTISEACLEPYLVDALHITSFLRLAKNLSNSDFTLAQNENGTAITVDGNSSEVLKILYSNNYDISEFNEKKATHSEGHLEIRIDENGFLSDVNVLIDYQSKNHNYCFEYALALTASEKACAINAPEWAQMIMQEEEAMNSVYLLESKLTLNSSPISKVSLLSSR